MILDGYSYLHAINKIVMDHLLQSIAFVKNNSYTKTHIDIETYFHIIFFYIGTSTESARMIVCAAAY